MEIYARWESSSQNKSDDIMKLLPLGLIAVMFGGLALIEFGRMKSGGGLWQKKKK